MKNPKKVSIKSNSILFFHHAFFPILFFIFFTACSIKPEPYSLLEFTGGEQVSNYSKSLLLTCNKADSAQPIVSLGGKGDLFMFGDFMFLLNDTSTQNRFSCQYNDSVFYVNGKIYSFNIPGNDNMIPWLKNIKGKDLSGLQIIQFESKIQKSYLPYLTELAGIRPDAGIVFNGEIRELAEVLKIIHPQFIGGPTFHRTDYDLLTGLTGIKILMVSPGDSLIMDPLPPLPSLEQLFLTEINGKKILPENFLKNNRQIKRVVLEDPGTFDLAILTPLVNLQELVVRGADTILHFDLINNHKKLEVLSLATDKHVYEPSLIKLPSLRWILIPAFVTQKEFNFLVEAHPDLEVIEIFRNDTITNLQPLSNLPKLVGLTVTDTVMDIGSLKKLTNLKYLSLPAKCLKDSLLKADLQKSLPNTRIVANEGFCMGSGWLLLLIPLVLIFRFFTVRKKQTEL